MEALHDRGTDRLLADLGAKPAGHTPSPLTVREQVARDGIHTQAIMKGGSNLGYTAFGNVGEEECRANAHLWAAAKKPSSLGCA
jgi:hypothetical protein